MSAGLTRAVVAMSGGVDSSVAASLLVEQGYEVIGVMMHLWAEEENRCCAADAVDDARGVAAQLGIPFHLVDYEAVFKASVVDQFLLEYSSGRTPNPCLRCNEHVRFGRLLRYAQELGAQLLATGHYARVERQGTRFRLRAGVDSQKDQSYVLYMLGQAQLRHVLFPLGQYSKKEVRHIARQHNLPVADRAESMELCFVSGRDYRRFVRDHAPVPPRPGPILDQSGRALGQHQGLAYYTVGQRKGLRIAAAEPLYVLRIDAARNALVVGPASELGRDALLAEDVRYVDGSPPSGARRVRVKIRYKAAPVDAVWTPLDGGTARVQLATPLRDITPGQAAVAYEGDAILGGGIISE